MIDANEDPIITVCKGPPRCHVDAVKTSFMQDGKLVDLDTYMRNCRWCKRITVHPDGSETVTDVARA
jgi:hypothetical protein